MASRPQMECIIGESGSGKSLYVSAFQTVAFLRDESGDYWHNLPLRPEGLAKLVGKPVEEIEPRLKLIPQDELKTWMEGKGGPWTFFKDKDITGAHIVMDEAHLYFGKKHSKQHLHELGVWVSELRHNGATAQLITQHEFKISTDARNEAGVQTRIYNPNQIREHFTGAKWYDVLQMVSKFRGKRVNLTIVREGVQRGRSARDFFSDSNKYIWHKPEHYACYNSYNNIQKGGHEAGEVVRPKEEWERFSWPRLLIWYLDRNLIPTGIRVGVLVALVWLFLFGGLSMIVDGFFSTIQNSVSAIGGEQPGKLEPKANPTRPGQTGPQPTMAPLPVDPAKYAELVKTNQYMAQKLQEAAKYAEELTGLVAVVNDTCYWADGTVGKQGEFLNVGPFAGNKIVSVDGRSGTVQLSNNVVLRVGVLSPAQYARVRAWQAASEGLPNPVGPGTTATNPQRDLSVGSPSLQPIPSDRFRNGNQGDGSVRGNSDAGVHEPARRSIRRLRGGGTAFGPDDSDGGVLGNPASGVPGNSGSASGLRAGGTPGPVLPRPAETGRQSRDGSEDSPSEP